MKAKVIAKKIIGETEANAYEILCRFSLENNYTKKLLELVKDTREAQKKYFTKRNKESLEAAKKAEQALDEYLLIKPPDRVGIQKKIL